MSALTTTTRQPRHVTNLTTKWEIEVGDGATLFLNLRDLFEENAGAKGNSVGEQEAEEVHYGGANLVLVVSHGPVTVRRDLGYLSYIRKGELWSCELDEDSKKLSSLIGFHASQSVKSGRPDRKLREYLGATTWIEPSEKIVEVDYQLEADVFLPAVRQIMTESCEVVSKAFGGCSYFQDS